MKLNTGIKLENISMNVIKKDRTFLINYIKSKCQTMNEINYNNVVSKLNDYTIKELKYIYECY